MKGPFRRVCPRRLHRGVTWATGFGRRAMRKAEKGSFAVAATLLLILLARGVQAADPAPLITRDRPIEDLIYWNTNFDDTHTPESAQALAKYLSPGLGFVAGVREGAIGPPSTRANPRPEWNWDRLAWLRDIHRQSWMQENAGCLSSRWAPRCLKATLPTARRGSRTFAGNTMCSRSSFPTRLAESSAGCTPTSRTIFLCRVKATPSSATSRTRKVTRRGGLDRAQRPLREGGP